ncbi:DUF6286 domain-containing protein [Streptomyces sp. HPF1205]|uniref:DUF6286 domain-containing protein n=1 Tax=Streptomyces sp. HPF1205 TaxID=2873262 RepID=UPI001CECF297|nr:DUF6286 domain-containing protein [Streptomyces sp. HPF1205]
MSDDEPPARPGPGQGPEPDAERPAAGQPPSPARVSVEKRPEPGRIPPYAVTSEEPGTVKIRRFWSGRRVPAAIVAAVLLGLSGLFLYDIASVRAGRDAMRWRVDLADELATRPLDDVWVMTGAAVAAALGLWLIVLALTPGERRLLPMSRRGASGVRAGLERRAAEFVLRDRAMEVSGIRWARVRVRRRRIVARAGSHFRDLEDVRRELTDALGEAVRQLGLARAPHLTVHVQRAEKKA